MLVLSYKQPLFRNNGTLQKPNSIGRSFFRSFFSVRFVSHLQTKLCAKHSFNGTTTTTTANANHAPYSNCQPQIHEEQVYGGKKSFINILWRCSFSQWIWAAHKYYSRTKNIINIHYKQLLWNHLLMYIFIRIYVSVDSAIYYTFQLRFILAHSYFYVLLMVFSFYFFFKGSSHTSNFITILSAKEFEFREKKHVDKNYNNEYVWHQCQQLQWILLRGVRMVFVKLFIKIMLKRRTLMSF